MLLRLILTICLVVPLPAMAAEWLDGLPEVPLMPGLVEDETRAMVFDKPGGSIAMAGASGASAPATIRQWYRETLPQLGWTRMRNTRGDVFLREGVRLRVEVTGNPGNAGASAQVAFTLVPG